MTDSPAPAPPEHSHTAAWGATGLRCQRLVDPVGIDRPHPTFDWVPSGQSDETIVGYQVLVASDPDVLRRGTGDLWDSGMIRSDEVTGVRYAGPTLTSRRQYWWTVRLWNDHGVPGPYAPLATFEMGLLDPVDRVGAWIAGGPGVSSPLLRTEFEVPGQVRRGRAYVAALGYYELRLNGARVGDYVLEPATTTYTHDPDLVDCEDTPAKISSPRVLYSTYDITDQVRQGANAAGLMLGHGWYSAEADNGPGPFPRSPYGDRPAAFVRIEIDTDDGDPVIVTSGDGWLTAPGPIVYNDYAHGERYDARRAMPGWASPGLADDGWIPAHEVEPPAGTLRSQLVEPIRVIETLPAAVTTKTPDGHQIVDFGQHFSGWTRIRVSGTAGERVELRHAGEITADGELDDDANMGAWLAARQTDTYILDGSSDEEIWEPRFTLHGFRYVQVSTSSPDVQVHGVDGRVVHSDLRPSGDFECADDLLNRIHHNVLWTFRSSFQGFPQDAADRAERVGWVGDPGWSVEDYLYDFDARAFWLKWLDDLADTQLPNGQFPTICPIHWRGGIEIDQSEWEIPEGQEVPELPTWPYTNLTDFAMTSYPSVAWNLYTFYGDRSILEEHYAGMRRGLEYLRSRATDFLLHEGLGDHMEPQPDGTCSVTPQQTPVELTSTVWFYAVTRMVLSAAEVLGHNTDTDEYRRLAASIKQKFNDAFLDPATGRYATGSQTAQAMPLWHGLVPDEHREQVARALVEQITERDNGHLSTGTMGTAALQNVLPEIGAADVMYRIATQETFPSWGHQVAAGATTVWETWGGDPTFSRNMKLMAMIEKFLFNDVAGLAPAAAGWRRVRIQPRLTQQLSHARGRVHTVRGEAAVDWRLGNNTLRLDAEVPPSSDAEIWLPTGSFGDAESFRLEVDDRPVWSSADTPDAHSPLPPGVQGVRRSGTHVLVDTSGGTYRLRLTAIR